MSSNYIPPHLRNRKQQEIKRNETIDVSDKSFPTLGTAVPVSQTRWNGSQSFSHLASEWNEKDEENARNKEYKLQENREDNYLATGFYRHYNKIRQENKKVYIDEEKYQNDDVTSDDWIDVKSYKKPRKVKTLEEIVEEEEAEEKRLKELENKWVDDGPEAYKTYWDERI